MTNGVYQTGGRVVGGVTNRVAITIPLVLRSVNGPALTVIQGYQVPARPFDPGVRCVWLTDGASLVGFTLANGTAPSSADTEPKRCGGGVWCASTAAVVSNCILTGNYASAYGGGAYYGTLNNCRFEGNTAGYDGGGSAFSTLNNCVMTGNSGGLGGGAYGAPSYGGPSVLNNCTVVGNDARSGSGGGAYGCTLRNCIVYFNTGNFGSQSANYQGSLTYCCTTPLPFTGTGNFTNAPLFVEGAFRLQIDSPCINVGNNSHVVGIADVNGDPRIVADTVDIGACEYQGPYTLLGWTDGGGSVEIGPPLGNDFSNLLRVVTATPAFGWNLLQWLGDAADSAPVLDLYMTRNKAVQAVFATTLSTAVSGSGSIIVSPASLFYPYGTKVHLTAVPSDGHYFDTWADSGGTNNPRTMLVTESTPAVTATFAPPWRARPKHLGGHHGRTGPNTVTPSGNRFDHNARVAIQATPEPGQDFLGWTGGASGAQDPLVLTVTSNTVIEARFTKRPTLRVGTPFEGMVEEGFRLTLMGEFGAAYQFFGSPGWSGWTPVGMVTNTWGTVQFTDPVGINTARQFYRALLDE